MSSPTKTHARTALVTGSARGIGRAINERLARDGYRCVVHYRRDADSAEQAAQALRASGADCLVVQADLGQADEIDAMFDTVREAFGGLDVFVANAASTALRPLLQTEPRHAERTYRESVLNLIVSLRRAAELLRDDGRLVYVSGLQAHAAYPGYGLLGPAKAAGEEMMKHLAVELGARGITANSVVPGLVETVSAHLSLGEEYDRLTARLIAGIPLHRGAQPADIAELVGFLASPAAAYISGQAIVIDGGMSAVGTAWPILQP